MSLKSDTASGFTIAVDVAEPVVRQLARNAAKSSGGWSFKGGVIGLHKIVEERDAAEGLVFSVLAPNKRELIEFGVGIAPAVAGGGTLVTVFLSKHIQARTTNMIGVPLDRWRVAGIGAYAKFLRTFQLSLIGNG